MVQLLRCDPFDQQTTILDGFNMVLVFADTHWLLINIQG